MKRLLSVLIVLAQFACDGDPRPVAPLPDAAPRLDAGPRLDLGLDAEVVSDASVDLGEADLGPDMAPPVPGPDDASQVVMLALRNQSRVAWYADGRIYDARLSDDGEVLGTRDLFAAATALDAPLLAGRESTQQAAWLFVPDGPDSAYRAYDLSQAEPEALDTDIWPPARVVVAENAVQLVGRSAPGFGAPIAWRRIAHPDVAPPVDAGMPEADMGDAGVDAEPEPPTDERVLDFMGIPDVHAATAALSGTVLAFEGGMCALMRASSLRGEWLCNGDSDARLFGALESLFFVAQRPEGIGAWPAVPGHAGDADTATVLVPGGTLVEWLADTGPLRVARVRDYLCLDQAGCLDDAACTPDQTCFDGRCTPRTCTGNAECPDGQRCASDGHCQITCATDAECPEREICVDGACRDQPCQPGTIECAAGHRCEEAEGVWLFEDNRARRVTWPGDQPGVVYVGRGQPYGVVWANDGEPTVQPLDTLNYAAMPTVELPDDCSPPAQPEDCSGTDRNCDGTSKGGRCCLTENVSETVLRLPASPEGAWRVLYGDNRIYLLSTMTYSESAGRSAELHTIGAGLSDNSANPPLARWPGTHQIEHVANLDSRIVATATDADGEATLLWYLGSQGLSDDSPPQGARSALPCGPVLGLDLLAAGAPGPTARVHCADASYAIPALGEAGEALPRPEGAPVRWMTTRALGQDDLVLVARGDDHTLELWQRTAEGYAIALDDDDQPQVLPEPLVMLPPQARDQPIYTAVVEGGWNTRIIDGRWLEVADADGSWRRAPASRWATQVRVSRHEPMALSLGADSENGLPRLWFHALGANDPYWGHLRSTRAETFTARNAGIELGAFSNPNFALPVPVFIDAGDTMRSKPTQCAPSPERPAAE